MSSSLSLPAISAPQPTILLPRVSSPPRRAAVGLLDWLRGRLACRWPASSGRFQPVELARMPYSKTHTSARIWRDQPLTLIRILSATLYRYPEGFQDATIGCVRPWLSVARDIT